MAELCNVLTPPYSSPFVHNLISKPVGKLLRIFNFVKRRNCPN